MARSAPGDSVAQLLTVHRLQDLLGRLQLIRQAAGGEPLPALLVTSAATDPWQADLPAAFATTFQGAWESVTSTAAGDVLEIHIAGPRQAVQSFRAFSLEALRAIGPVRKRLALPKQPDGLSGAAAWMWLVSAAAQRVGSTPREPMQSDRDGSLVIDRASARRAQAGQPLVPGAGISDVDLHPAIFVEIGDAIAASTDVLIWLARPLPKCESRPTRDAAAAALLQLLETAGGKESLRDAGSEVAVAKLLGVTRQTLPRVDAWAAVKPELKRHWAEQKQLRRRERRLGLQPSTGDYQREAAVGKAKTAATIAQVDARLDGHRPKPR
jgi:hypothetical protein